MNKVSSITLAVGEWHKDRAHSHAVTGELTHLEGSPNEANSFLVDSEYAVLRHEEHGPMVFEQKAGLRSGTFFEYDPIKQESRRVLD